MITSLRFENAIKKLYEAFHNNSLNPECCTQCAVGNILNNTESWKHLSDNHGSIELNYVGKVHQNLGRKFNGYTPIELLTIEATFLKGCGYDIPLNYKNDKPQNPTNKDILFKGLTAVINYLCRIEGIKNVMDYSKLFEVENDRPKYELV
jgi:hypothetical protein